MKLKQSVVTACKRPVQAQATQSPSPEQRSKGCWERKSQLSQLTFQWVAAHPRMDGWHKLGLLGGSVVDTELGGKLGGRGSMDQERGRGGVTL